MESDYYFEESISDDSTSEPPAVLCNTASFPTKLCGVCSLHLPSDGDCPTADTDDDPKVSERDGGTVYVQSGNDTSHTIAPAFPLFQNQWRTRLIATVPDDWVEPVPEKYQSSRVKLRDFCLGLTQSYLSLTGKYVEFRRTHTKVKSDKADFMREFDAPSGVEATQLVEIISDCVQAFLDGFFTVEDLTKVSTLSLRHTAMGCLVDGFAIYVRLLTDLSSVYADYFPLQQGFGLRWKTLFLQRIEADSTILAVCQRAESSGKATSKSAEGVRALFRELRLEKNAVR